MILRNYLKFLLRTHSPKHYLQISTTSSHKLSNQSTRGVEHFQKFVEETSDTLNPDVCQVLCALCAPGTESSYIAETITQKNLAENNITRNVPIANSLVAGSPNVSKDDRIFTQKIRTVHVTYVEPTMQNIPRDK